MKYRKRPVEVEAVEWTGENVAEMYAFTRGFFTASDGGAVWDELRGAWIPVQPGGWVVKGVRGECYPVEAGVWADTYEEATPRLAWVVGAVQALDGVTGVYASREAADAAVAAGPGLDHASWELDRADEMEDHQ